MNCPNCNVTLLITDRQGIEIDYCPQCRGIWLDRGELDKIIERSDQPEQRDDPGRRHDDGRRGYDHDHPHDYRYKRKKGLLGELFDF